MATPWRESLLVAGAIAAGSLMTPAHAGDGTWAWPLPHTTYGSVSNAFDAPDTPYSRGHRGIDLPGAVGGDVLAVAPGIVTFAGHVAGLGVVTVDHGGERSTYQPVEPSVSVGAAVGAGEVIGTLRAIGSHCAVACLHLGRIAGNTYLDPLDRLRSVSAVRLVDPNGPVPVPPPGPTGNGILRRPVAGPITSPYGPRTHPVTGVHKLHDGVDFAAACGTPVRASAPGTVRRIGHSGAYGNHVMVADGSGLTTLYGHLSRTRVKVGQVVSTSSVIGSVGSTGLSTGCHLHLGAAIGGKSTDPLTLM